MTSSDDGPATVDPTIRGQLAAGGTATVANLLLKRGFRNVIMRDVAPLGVNQSVMVGTAYTLRFIPSREDLDSMDNYASEENVHRRAIEECPAGSVLVIDAFGCTDAASMGDLMAARLQRRGVVGAVTDGGFRDAAAIAETGLPCYQRGGAPCATPIALHPIDVDGPVGCGGVAVYPGDMVLGDADGVAVIPHHLVAEIAAEAADVAGYEDFAAAQIAAGRSIFGLFPATDESRREYDELRASSDRPARE